MADRHFSSGQIQRTYVPTRGGGFTVLRRLHEHATNSTQLVGFMTLIVSGAILLILTGMTVTATVLGLIFFSPLIVLSSPIWIPVGTVLFVLLAGFLSFCGVVAGFWWLYRYFKGRNPPGSRPFEYARSRIYDTASHVKDYAGGYMRSKVKDAAPGA